MTKLHSVASMFRRERLHQSIERTSSSQGRKQVRFKPNVLVYADLRDVDVIVDCLWYSNSDYTRFKSDAFLTGRDRYASDTGIGDRHNYSCVIEQLMDACHDYKNTTYISTVQLQYTLRLLLQTEPDLEGFQRYCVEEMFQMKMETLETAHAILTNINGKNDLDKDRVAEEIQHLTRPAYLFARIMAQASASAVSDSICETRPRVKKQRCKQSALSQANFSGRLEINPHDHDPTIYDANRTN